MYHSRADSKYEFPIISSDTECLEMLVVLHICLFHMSNDSGDMSLVTLKVLYHTISLEKCSVTYLWVNLIFNGIIHLLIGVLNLTTNKIFHMNF